MARRTRPDPHQPGLFDIFGGDGGGDEPRDTPDRGGGLRGPARAAPQWSPAQRETFLDSQAARISYQVAELAAEMGAQAVGAWTRSRGEHPDYLTKAGMLNTARSQAMEIVLNNELYEQIPTEDGQPSNLWGAQRPSARSQSGALGSTLDPAPVSQRPQPEHRGADRGSVAGPELLGGVSDQGRIPASRPGRGWPALPSGPDDPLTSTLAQMVYTDLRDDGIPER